MNDNPVLRLKSLGQSVWMDNISRSMITSGELQRWVSEDGLGGITSNPSIFEKAIDGSHDYDDAIRHLAKEGAGAEQIYRELALADVGAAADILRPLYRQTRGADGYASIEVSPHLAYDVEGTVREARELWKALNRPNVFVKVPATAEGIPAIRTLIGEGISVNVTLLFGLSRYVEVANAYMVGLEDRMSRGEPLDQVTSVASIFLSRIDTLVDSVLETKAHEGGPDSRLAESLRGQAAISTAKVAYQTYRETIASGRWRQLADAGASPQRLLWASTSTKNPDYSDVKYVEALIGPDTISTMPRKTLDAYRDHGRPGPRLEDGVSDARSALRELAGLGIDLDAVSRQLEAEGVEKFVEPFDKLMATLSRKRDSALTGRMEAA